MRFYLDEHISIAVAHGLRQRGHDVETVNETKNTGKNDKEQLSYAVEKQRIIVTADSDFLAMAKRENIRHPGIVFLTDQQVSPGGIISKIDRIALFLSQKDMENHVEFI